MQGFPPGLQERFLAHCGIRQTFCRGDPPGFHVVGSFIHYSLTITRYARTSLDERYSSPIDFKHFVAVVDFSRVKRTILYKSTNFGTKSAVHDCWVGNGTCLASHDVGS